MTIIIVIMSNCKEDMANFYKHMAEIENASLFLDLDIALTFKIFCYEVALVL